jgi:hypothetical protein
MRILFLALFITAHSAFAQLSEKKWLISGVYHTGAVDSTAYWGLGARSEWRVHERLSLNYNLERIVRRDNISPLIIFGLISSADNQFFNLGGWGTALGILALVAPDGVSFHIPYRFKWEFSPYANVLGVDFMRNRNTDKFYIRYGASFGVKTSYWMENNWTLQGFLETRKVAGVNWSVGGGVGVGYSFGTRD